MALTPSAILDTRRRLGLSQDQFGQLVGAHWVTVSKWERGQLRPSPYQAGMILKFREAAKSEDADELGQRLGQLLVIGGALAVVFFLLKRTFESK